MDDFKLNTVALVELGEHISEELEKNGVHSQISLGMCVPNGKLIKIDEDLFYRTREDETKEFMPSDGKIMVKVGNVLITIEEENGSV